MTGENLSSTDLPVIQSLWLGPSLSTLEQTALQSFLHHGHEFHLYVYEEVKNVPDSVLLKDAEQILPASRIFKYKHFDSYAGFANLFRYALLLEKGHFWVDTDVVCLRPFEKRRCYLATERVRGSTHLIKAANAIMCAEPGHEIIEYCFDYANSVNPDDLKWGQTGPSLVTRAINHFKAFEYFAEPEIFCPIDWWSWHQALSVSPPDNRLQESWAVHLWHELWRRNGVDKLDDFPISSLIERFRRGEYVADSQKVTRE